MAGFGKEELNTLEKLTNAEKSDLFDVVEYVFNSETKPITREARVAAAQATLFPLLDAKQRKFIEFVLSKYIETGVEQLDQDKLPILLTNKYQSLEDAKAVLGEVPHISRLFVEFQQHLYREKAALQGGMSRTGKGQSVDPFTCTFDDRVSISNVSAGTHKLAQRSPKVSTLH